MEFIEDKGAFVGVFVGGTPDELAFRLLAVFKATFEKYTVFAFVDSVAVDFAVFEFAAICTSCVAKYSLPFGFVAVEIPLVIVAIGFDESPFPDCFTVRECAFKI